MPHIASTLPTDMQYTLWQSNPGGINNSIKHVTVYGGHGVAHRRKHGGLETPEGVLTKVTDDELALLEKDETFRTHKKNGYVKVLKTAKAPEPEKVASDMKQDSPDSPLTDKDFKDGGRAAAPKGLKLSTTKEKR